MRLRRETGDWTIKIKVDKTASSSTLTPTQLPKGLSAEDFVGAIIQFDDVDGNEQKTLYSPAFACDAPAGNGYSVIICAAVSFELNDRTSEVDVLYNLLYYDRRSGHLSFYPDDFDPVEPDEGGEDVTGFVITRNGSAYTVTPSTVTFTKADSQKYTTPWYKFIGKTVTDFGGQTYTITEEMIGGRGNTGSWPLYFVNPTDKSGNHLLLTSSGSGSTFPMVMTVTYAAKE